GLQPIVGTSIEENDLVLTDVDVWVDARQDSSHHVGMGRLRRDDVEAPPYGPHLRSALDDVDGLDDFSSGDARLRIPLVHPNRSVHLDDFPRRLASAGYVVRLSHFEEHGELLPDPRV